MEGCWQLQTCPDLCTHGMDVLPYQVSNRYRPTPFPETRSAFERGLGNREACPTPATAFQTRNQFDRVASTRRVSQFK